MQVLVTANSEHSINW